MRRVEHLPSWVAPALTLALLVVLWELFVRLRDVPAFVLPSPSAVLDMTIQWRAHLPMQFGVTLREVLIGFGLSIFVGVPIAALITYSPLLSKTIYPILLMLQSVPKIAIAPLLLLWVGYGEAPKVIVAFLVCFFPIVIGTAAGLRSAPSDMLDLAQALSASKLQIFIKVRFPWAMPQIFVGLKVAITLAVVGAVIGEFVGADKGLGFLIMASSSQVNTALAFSSMILLSVMSIALFYALEWLEGLLVPWAED